MNQILKEIQQIQNWKNLYDSYILKNNLNSISSKLVEQQNFQNFQNFIETIIEKSPRKSKKLWVSNQRRILYVILNCISVISQSTVEQFVKLSFYQQQNQEIQRLNRVFPYKEKHSVQYELRKLGTNSKQNRRRWSEKEQNLLSEVLTQISNNLRKSANKNKWNEIARQLFITSKGEYFRQGKHCRERFQKLKSCKGSQSKLQEISPCQQISGEKSMKFHSCGSFNQQNHMDIEVDINDNIKYENFNSIEHKKQPLYNKNLVVCHFKSQSEKKCIEKLNSKIKKCQLGSKSQKCDKNYQQQQPSKVLIFSQTTIEKKDELKTFQQSFNNIYEQKNQQNNFVEMRSDNFQNNYQENINQSAMVFPSSIQTININNFMIGNPFVPNMCPINFPIWPLSMYPFGYFQQ